MSHKGVPVNNLFFDNIFKTPIFPTYGLFLVKLLPWHGSLVSMNLLLYQERRKWKKQQSNVLLLRSSKLL